MTENTRLSEEDIDDLADIAVASGDDYLLRAIGEIRAMRRDLEQRTVAEKLDIPQWRRPTEDDLPAWNSDPMTEDDMNFLRAFVRSMVTGGHRNIAEIISHAENQIVELRAQVSMLREDRQEAWVRNAKLVSKLIYLEGHVDEELIAP